jgi:hypothetical protein
MANKRHIFISLWNSCQMFFAGIAGLLCVTLILTCISENPVLSEKKGSDITPARIISGYHELYAEIESQDIYTSPVISARFLLTLNLTIRDVVELYSKQKNSCFEQVATYNIIQDYEKNDTLLLSHMLNKAISENLHSIFDARVKNGKQIIHKKFTYLQSAILEKTTKGNIDYSRINQMVKKIADSIANKFLPPEYIKYPDFKVRDTMQNIFSHDNTVVPNKWVSSLLKYESILNELGLQNVPNPEISNYKPMNDKILYAEALEIYTLSKPLQYKFKWIAEFWSDDFPGVTYSPVTRWFSILNQIIKKEKPSFDEVQKMYFLMSLALHETAVSCWKLKYSTLQVRPSAYIQAKIDPSWRPFHDNPPFPAYPSGHSAFGASTASVLEYFFSKTYEFTDNSHRGNKAFLSEPRSFTSFREMAEENALSRLYMGVHFRKDCEDGLHLGERIAKNILNNMLLDTTLKTDGKYKISSVQNESIFLDASFNAQN